VRARPGAACGPGPAAPGSLPVVLERVRTPEGVEIACEVSGQGPPLVLVHGAGSARWGFSFLRPLLEERYTVVAIDRRGRGDSSDGDRYAVEREFEDVAAVVRSVASDGSEPVLFGHSYGALVSAGAAPLIEGLPRLVLYEPPMGGVLAGPAVVDRWEALIAAGDRDAVVSEFLADIGGYSPVELEELRASELWELRKTVAHTVPRELRAEGAFQLDRAALAALDIPVLMFVGGESPHWATRSTAAYAEVLPNVTVRTLEGQGHGALAAAPELVASELP
jgi:pimeloyl-ACP methyl ester carboxylesterase